MKTNLLLLSVLMILCLSAMMPLPVQSAELVKVGNFLKVIDPLKFKLRDDVKGIFIAQRGIRFKIISIKNDTCYVDFKSVGKNSTISKDSTVTKDRVYCIKASEINESTCQFTRGLYAAALTVPIKYRFELKNAPSALSTNFDISSALGYSFGVFGVTLTPVGFAGLATISLNDANSSAVETRLGITYSGGAAIAFSRNFQFALVAGADLVTGTIADQWPYQNKIWISIGIGYKFLDL